MTTIVEKIRARGHWVVRLHPDTYDASPSRNLASLEQAVRDSAVSVRGWDFPHYDLQTQPTRRADSVEQSLDWEERVEFWRAYKSGQFISITGLPDDWCDQSNLWPVEMRPNPGAILSVENAVFRFVEIYEFAARWSRALAIQTSLVLAFTLRGLENRKLRLNPRRRVGFLGARTSKAPDWSYSKSYPSTALLSEPRELAIPPTIVLFELFGWDVNREVVREIQGELPR
jgi:hypothetical protein